MPVERICQLVTCGKTFLGFPSDLKFGKGKYCSKQCAQKAMSHRVTTLCQNPDCGRIISATEKDIEQGFAKYCSIPCFALTRTLQNSAKLIPRICANVLCGKTFYVSITNAVQSVQQYCSHPCSFSRTPLIDRLLPNIVMCEHGDCIYCCWPWIGCTNGAGYGVLSLNKSEKGKSRLVHRLAWEHFRKQTMPSGKYACHHCDNPPCCNPDHIYPGTQKQNMQDAKQRGRMNTDTTNYARGERNPLAKLSERDIHTIWELKNQGLGAYRIAKRLRVAKTTIQYVLQLKTWRHVSLSLIAEQCEEPEPIGLIHPLKYPALLH